MGVNILPQTVTRQRRDCDLNPGCSAHESSTLTTRLPSHPFVLRLPKNQCFWKMHNETNHKSSHRIVHGIDRLVTVYYSGVRAEWDRCRVASLRS